MKHEILNFRNSLQQRALKSYGFERLLVGDIVRIKPSIGNFPFDFMDSRYEIITASTDNSYYYFTKLILFEGCFAFYEPATAHYLKSKYRRHIHEMSPVNPIKVHQIKTFLAGNQL